MNTTQDWLLRYIVTAETAAIMMMISFFATGYGDLVTHEELGNIQFPYTMDKPIITTHIREAELNLRTIRDSLQALNLRISNEAHVANLRITLLEKQVELISR